MYLKNTKFAYGWVGITLHWVMALAVIGLFALGLYMVELSYYDSWYRGSLDLHKSVGILLFSIFLIRIVWRTVNEKPVIGSNSKYHTIELKLAKLIQWVFYFLLLFLMASGYLISTADGRSISVFGLFSVPALPWSIANQEDIAGEVHELLAWTLIVLASLHALAALKHHFIDKDDILKRMLYPPQKN